MSQLDRHSVRRVVLPSGKTIDVVYFGSGSPGGSQSTASTAQESEGLHVCPRCTSETVFPADWQEAGPVHWEMSLRCPNCEWTGEGIFAQELVERLEEVLDDGTDALVRDLKRLTHANMEEEVARFTSALYADLILPMDF